MVKTPVFDHNILGTSNLSGEVSNHLVPTPPNGPKQEVRMLNKSRPKH